MSHFGALAAAASGRSPFMLYPGVGIAGTTANALDKHWYSAWSQPLSAAISPTGKHIVIDNRHTDEYYNPCSMLLYAHNLQELRCTKRLGTIRIMIKYLLVIRHKVVRVTQRYVGD